MQIKVLIKFVILTCQNSSNKMLFSYIDQELIKIDFEAFRKQRSNHWKMMSGRSCGFKCLLESNCLILSQMGFQVNVRNKYGNPNLLEIAIPSK